MVQLTELDISNCNFGGTFPDEVSELSNLEKLFVGGNRFVGTMPLHRADQTDAPPGTEFPDDDNNIVIIVAAAVGALLALGLIIGFFIIIRQNRSKRENTFDAMLDRAEKNRRPSGMNLHVELENNLDMTRYKRGDAKSVLPAPETKRPVPAFPMSPTRFINNGARATPQVNQFSFSGAAAPSSSVSSSPRSAPPSPTRSTPPNVGSPNRGARSVQPFFSPGYAGYRSSEATTQSGYSRPSQNMLHVSALPTDVSVPTALEVSDDEGANRQRRRRRRKRNNPNNTPSNNPSSYYGGSYNG